MYHVVYGIELAMNNLTEGAFQKLYDRMLPDIKEEADQYCQDNFPATADREKMLRDFFCHGYTSMDVKNDDNVLGAIAETINAKLTKIGMEGDPFCAMYGCLFVFPTLPKKRNAWVISEQEIQEKMSHWFGGITKTPVNPEWFTIWIDDIDD